MSHFLRITIVMVFAVASAGAQTFPSGGYLRLRVKRPEIPTQIPGPEGLRDYVVNGKLRLTLADAIRLTLANNTEVRINRLDYETTKFALQRAYQPFDPVWTSSFNARRSLSPTSSSLEGASTRSDLNQTTQLGYSQSFLTGTRYDINFTASKFATNSQFATFNPSIFSGLNLSLSQPLLRNRGLYPNKAPIVIARRNQDQSRASFEAQVSDVLARATERYWAVVQARENLAVLRSSLELAEATYKQNKRALELGALPPLDIYRSESQVATRRVQVIQAEYQLKEVEDDFRNIIGADIDPYVGALDIDLVEAPEPGGELFTIDAQQALKLALERRPELEALRQRLANDDTGIQLAHNGLQPDMTLTAFYSTSGRGGNQIDATATPPVIVRAGGLGDALSQLRSLDFPTYGFNLQLRLPLRDRAAEADLGIALVAKRRSLYALRQREEATRLEARTAVHQLEQAKLSMAAAKIARDLAEKTLEAEQKKYELGVQTIFFVLEAQTQLAQGKLNLVEAQIGYQRAITSVHRTTGQILDRYKIQIAP